MPNKVVIFPEGKQAAANAYRVAVDAAYANEFEPGATWAYIRNDAFGQWVVPYYDPPWEFITGDGFEEPAELIPLRADGVLHDTAVWPEPEDL